MKFEKRISYFHDENVQSSQSKYVNRKLKKKSLHSIENVI